jgi:hypothetical protein
MLGVRNYERTYVEACRRRVDADVEAFNSLVSKTAPDDAGLTEFEARYFSNLTIVLDAMFVHRLRTVEGKDGNPLNEVRVMCASMLNNQNRFTVESPIKMSPAKSVLKLHVGDDIRMDQQRFLALSQAFFDEIERKFVATDE